MLSCFYQQAIDLNSMSDDDHLIIDSSVLDYYE